MNTKQMKYALLCVNKRRSDLVKCLHTSLIIISYANIKVLI